MWLLWVMHKGSYRRWMGDQSTWVFLHLFCFFLCKVFCGKNRKKSLANETVLGVCGPVVGWSQLRSSHLAERTSSPLVPCASRSGSPKSLIHKWCPGSSSPSCPHPRPNQVVPAGRSRGDGLPELSQLMLWPWELSRVKRTLFPSWGCLRLVLLNSNEQRVPLCHQSGSSLEQCRAPAVRHRSAKHRARLSAYEKKVTLERPFTQILN